MKNVKMMGFFLVLTVTFVFQSNANDVCEISGTFNESATYLVEGDCSLLSSLKSQLISESESVRTAILLNIKSDVYFANCKITDKKGSSTFEAEGNCKEVTKAYKDWLKLVEA